MLEGGTLTSSAGSLVLLLVRRRSPPGGGAGNGVVRGWSVVGTLLGPEGTGPSGEPGGLVGLVGAGLHLIPLQRLWVLGGWWGHGAGDWSYVENCTVDASIF